MHKLPLKILAFVALAWILSLEAGAYVTSAVLEYSATMPAKFYLNGVQITNAENKSKHENDYVLMCSSDNSIPLELLNYKKENVLAVHMKGLGGWQQLAYMGLSYRLTIYQSAGSPVVIWSEPGNTKYLHLEPGQKVPPSWEKPAFNDSSWGEAINSRMINSGWGWPQLPDPAFKGLLGQEGYVPFVSHNGDGHASAGMINLYRSRFSIPDKPGRLQIYPNPAKPKRGDMVTVYMVPARDVATMGNIQMEAVVPQGLNISKASPGYSYDKAGRKLAWTYPSPSKFLTLNLEAVEENSGFVNPEKALGPWRDRPRYTNDGKIPFSDFRYWDSAYFPSGASAWYKTSRAPIQDGTRAPIILSVTFQSQMFPQGYQGSDSYAVDQILFNYSVDGSRQGVLKKDVIMCNYMGGNGQTHWANGKHDATYDRRWTWKDLSNVRVRFSAKQVSYKKPDNRLLSCIISVRYYDPADIAPYFIAQVAESNCTSLTLTGAVASMSNDSKASDSLALLVNQGSCPATPTPTPVPTLPPPPTPRPGTTAPPTPRPTAVPTVELVSTRPGIKDVSNSPEPFKRGGTYLYFSNRQPITSLTLNVFDSSGKTVVSLDAGSYPAGKNQFFYNGLNGSNRALAPGSYQIELLAKNGKTVESFRSSFTRGKDKFE